MRYLYVLMGLAVLASIAYASAGSFKVEMDVSTYVDASNPNASFSDNNTLLVASANGEPTKETYLSFKNNFGSVGIFKPDRISSATLVINIQKVEKPGKINAYFVHGPTFDTATWTDRPEYESSASSSLDVQKAGQYTIDVTPIIKKAVETCIEDCPYSIVLVSNDASIELSKEKKPTLEYTAN
ncbi:MAG: DNRLRE domain-containing protein [Methanotrichaceae archaeon]